MKFDHAVNHNGVYYRAGEEVPTEEPKKTIHEEPITKPEEEQIETPRRRGRSRKE